MPHFSPPLPFQRGRAGCPCVLAHGQLVPAAGVAVVCAGWWGPCPTPWAGVVVIRAGRWGPRPTPWTGVVVIRAGRWGPRPCPGRSLQRLRAAKYCPVFMLSLAGVQQDRNSRLARNYGAFSDQQSGKSRLPKSKMTKYRALRVKTPSTFILRISQNV